MHERGVERLGENDRIECFASWLSMCIVEMAPEISIVAMNVVTVHLKLVEND
jgi:hypothetical protein